MYYNQRDYPNAPYPAKGYEDATIKSAGCGPCCAAMVVEGLSGKSYPPPAMAELFIIKDARVPGGTDMAKGAKIIAELTGGDTVTTSSGTQLVDYLEMGCWAIANVGGNRQGYIGLFSDGGHYVVVRGIEPDGRLIVWDPGYYAGKFDKAGRKGRVAVRGNDILVTVTELERDTESRTPNYYLFWPKEDKPMTPETHTPAAWAKEAWGKATKAGILDGTYPQGSVTREQLAVILHRLGLLNKPPDA